MNALLGVFFHFIGGFASGSFYIPYKKVKGWSWESYWLAGGIFSWLIVPPLAAWLTVPGFWEIIKTTEPGTLGYAYLFGLLWGIGGLTYGLGVRYLGVSLGSSIILGLCMVFGALIPALYYQVNPADGKDTIGMLFETGWGRVVMGGLLVCIMGIIVSGKAGMRKEKELTTAATADSEAIPGLENTAAKEADHLSGKDEYKFGLGLLVAIISGILSACFNFGIEAGKPMADAANALWKAAHPGQGEFLFQNNVSYIVILWGGLTTNLIWCLILNARNKTFGDYTNARTPILANIIFCALAGTTWFLQFFFYGMGESKLGNGPSSWILHMAFIILIANVWGLVLKEWKGVSRKTLFTVVCGILIILVSVLLVGYGNSLR
ncbi:sugar:proton symporter [Niabella ginsenosidivorans]|uniref:Sugar:proton symporter n=1 Tax=Niabella ginsenosidivorans TaxID=1176587 RepID=A0A1A9I3C3_9BACT|nr:L-rhamnose/proton symporter RhaT [Niabella ginsenosidivorans]ANH82023.1 sugar:proton symporter [Niabella ginsenosidivorans]